MLRRGWPSLKLTLPCVVLNLSFFATAQTPGMQNPLGVHPRDRISGFIDDQDRVTLAGNRHPLAQPENEVGVVAPDYPMERMILTFESDARQQRALDQLVEAQHDPQSPYYHQWLTPQRFGERFGISENDLGQVTNWLELHGMTVEEITAGRRSLVFSGTAGQVESAFHTQIHAYQANGELHHANASDPQIPQALAEVVGGPVSLHDFRAEPLHRKVRKVLPEFSYYGSSYLAPADFATIYDVGPLYQESLTGSGQSVAIVGRTNIRIGDVRLFRNSFGIPANDPQIIINGSDPGVVSVGEESEADLDVEWSGAVARNASIKFVVSASTNSSDGVDLSAQYIVNHNLAPVMSTSFGLCEARLGSAGNAFLNGLWQQAAAQGITAFISSGDSGAAGCDSPSAASGSAGRGVNGLCSSPYDVCVGGTEFNDTANPSRYWSANDDPKTQASALSYIPENAWNESGSLGSGLWASGGGTSTVYAKPSWQNGPGVPTDGKRDVPMFH
jgi:pseudomonalisin